MKRRPNPPFQFPARFRTSCHQQSLSLCHLACPRRVLNLDRRRRRRSGPSQRPRRPAAAGSSCHMPCRGAAASCRAMMLGSVANSKFSDRVSHDWVQKEGKRTGSVTQRPNLSSSTAISLVSGWLRLRPCHHAAFRCPSAFV